MCKTKPCGDGAGRQYELDLQKNCAMVSFDHRVQIYTGCARPPPKVEWTFSVQGSNSINRTSMVMYCLILGGSKPSPCRRWL
jgi:hypothetical protein